MQPFEKPIYVTQPYLPPLNDYYEGLKEIWGNRWLTNNGPVLQRFENKLSDFFQSDNLCIFNNGTLALQIALQGMGVSGEAITTPFTFVATTHALFWNKVRPVFCDIETDYYTLDADKIEELITPWTTAIVAVHVFGYPCNLDKLSEIAKKHNLLLIYDAAHAFGVKVKGKPITDYGDLSMLSFHATKLFHSIEGGALIFQDHGLKQKFNYLKNFGFKNEIEVVMPGTNAKMNEFQALMGLELLKYMSDIIEKRKKIDSIYKERLANNPHIKFCKKLPQEIEHNFAYLPVEILEDEKGINRDVLYYTLKQYNIFTRKYFYPIIPDFSCYNHITIQDPLKQARKIADRILTLPIYPDLAHDDVYKICDVIDKITL